MRAIVALLIALGLQPLLAQQPAKTHWAVSYSHKDTRTSLIISEIRFADAAHGVAVGRLAKPGRPFRDSEPVALITADGGANWNLLRLKSHVRSLFFLDVGSCWTTAADGLWKSTDGGKSFKKVSSCRLGRVHFLDSRHGFAVGSDAHQQKFVPAEAFPPETFAGPAPDLQSVPWTFPAERRVTGPGSAPRVRMDEVSVPIQQLLETRDGGVTWKEHPVSKQLGGAFARSIEFAGNRGAAMGVVSRRGPSPPEARYSGVTVIAETSDGGNTWSVSRPTLPGLTNDYRLAPGGGYALVWHGGGMAPEIYRIEAGQTGVIRVFGDPDLVAKDLAVLGDDSFWLATVAHPSGGGIIPGGTEVKMLYSASGSGFSEVAIESRVTANNVVMTAAPGGTMWAATDTGTILKLKQD